LGSAATVPDQSRMDRNSGDYPVLTFTGNGLTDSGFNVSFSITYVSYVLNVWYFRYRRAEHLSSR
jgi:hypothetical protein